MADPVAAQRLVVIDDDSAMRLSCSQILARMGHEVETFADGAQGVAAVARLAPALVVVDLKMPGLSGLDVLTIVRCASLDTACILITAFGDSETVAEASDLGARVFQKPFDIDELVTTLVELAPPS